MDSCDPIPPYKHDMMTWTVGIDGKVWSVPPVSIDSATNKTGLRCSYVGAHKQAHIDLPILPHVSQWMVLSKEPEGTHAIHAYINV